jgi:LPS sulfotransferase NodH
VATAELPTADPSLHPTENALDSEVFDQPRPDAPPLRYLILSARRSGSYMLCRALIRAGLGVPHEYLLRDHVRALAPRWSVDPGPARGPVSSGYLEALVERRSCGGLFGAKLQYWQFERALQSPQGERFLDGARLIYLYREDVLKQAISFRHAEITGRWGSDGSTTTRPLRREDPFDPRGIRRKINLLLYDELGWRGVMARRGLNALHLSYEQLCADPRGAFAAIGRHLGLDAKKTASLAPEPPSPQVLADAALKARMLSAYLDQAGRSRSRGPLAHGAADALWSAWGRMNGLER